ncbi:hypothetical protein C8R47DRAFT_1077841 [Mycena vitilis]|nr:hypothetical protein C8R47DRAFT_1077841 [Mycena vitilis]
MCSRVPAGENGRDPAPPERRTGETVETSGRVVPRSEFPPRAGDGAQIPRRGARALPGITTSSTSSRIAFQGKDTELMFNRREGDRPQNLVRLPDTDSANTSPCNQNKNRRQEIVFVWPAIEEGSKPLKYRANKGNGAKPPMESKNWGMKTRSEHERAHSALNPAEFEHERGAVDECRTKKKVAGQSRRGPNDTSKEMTEEKAEKVSQDTRKRNAASKSGEPNSSLTVSRRTKEATQVSNPKNLPGQGWMRTGARVCNAMLVGWIFWEIAKRLTLPGKGMILLGPKKASAGEDGIANYKGRGRTLHSKEQMPTYLRSHSPIFFQPLPPLAGWISPPMYGEDPASPTHELVCHRMESHPAPTTTLAPDLVPKPTASPDADPCDRRLPAPTAVPRSSTQTGELYRFATYPPGTAPSTNDDSVLDPGLIDVDTGHEVRALPTRAHPDLPAAPRPGTPGPDRRLYEARPLRLAPDPRRVNSDVSMEDTPPRKTRRFKEKEIKQQGLTGRPRRASMQVCAGQPEKPLESRPPRPAAACRAY